MEIAILNEKDVYTLATNFTNEIFHEEEPPKKFFNSIIPVIGEEACPNCNGFPIKATYDEFIKILIDCKHCYGTGYKIDICLKCDGTGFRKGKRKGKIISFKCPTCDGKGYYIYRPNPPKYPHGLYCPFCTPRDKYGRFIKDMDRKIPQGKVIEIVPKSNNPKFKLCSVCNGTGRKKIINKPFYPIIELK